MQTRAYTGMSRAVIRSTDRIVHVCMTHRLLVPASYARSDPASMILSFLFRKALCFSACLSARQSVPDLLTDYSFSAHDSSKSLGCLCRYSMTDSTPGFDTRSGSFMVFLSATPPEAGTVQRSNWLPICRGPFYLVLRLYGPSKIAQVTAPPLYT
jgi:hypothetical protein